MSTITATQSELWRLDLREENSHRPDLSEGIPFLVMIEHGHYLAIIGVNPPLLLSKNG
jgi:hypothetical protein